MDQNQLMKAFQNNYNRVSNFFSSSANRQLLLSLTCKTTLANKEFSGIALENIIQQIEKYSNGELLVNSIMDYKLASYLQDEEEVQQAIVRLIENDQILSEVNFKKNHNRVFASLFLQGDRYNHAKRAKQLFEEMNHHHPFLTSNEDIPYVVLLTTTENDIVQQAETMASYYKILKNHRFKMGNQLQALTQIMTVYSVEYNEMLCQYILRLRETLLNNGIKVKELHYPFLGILALAATDEYKINEIVSLHTKLSSLQAFKHSKEYALIVAIQKAIKDLASLQAVVDVVRFSQLELLFDVAEFALDITTIFPNGILSMFNGDLFN